MFAMVHKIAKARCGGFVPLNAKASFHKAAKKRTAKLETFQVRFISTGYIGVSGYQTWLFLVILG